MSKILGKYKNAIDIKHNKKKWLKIQISKDSYIKVTEDHRFYLPDLKVWRKAKDLEVGNVLLSSI
jgi:intein/homing endonuclease